MSAAHNYAEIDRGRGAFNDTSNREAVRSEDIHQGRTAIILTFGQSNSTNSGDTPYVTRRRVLNFNLFDGRCYPARDPLLGATERRGNFAGRMADLLIERGAFDTVVLVPIGVGGSSVEQWTETGPYHLRLQIAIHRTTECGLHLTHLLWHQGETDARYAPDGARYAACFQNIYAGVRRQGAKAPIYVAQATRCNSEPVESIRRVQRSLVNPALGILAGPDTDTIGGEDRYDGCHMAESGLIKHARLWAETLFP